MFRTVGSRLSRVAWVVTVTGVVASLLSALPASAHGVTAPTPELRWAECDGGFQCATATVPLDYDQLLGATISLALIRLPAGDPGHKIGSIFLNPGGPGGSGVEFVRRRGLTLFSQEVRAKFDLVGFDPRGIAGSTPVRCFDTPEEQAASRAPFAFPVTAAEERIWVQADRTLSDACTRRAGAIIDHMATADVARDIDLLRAAVGDERTTFAGYSYGSQLGATYANMFPDRVRAVIVDGVIDPVSWTTGRGDEARTLPVDARLMSEQGAFETLQAFLSLCDKGAENCAFSDGDPRVRYAQLAQRLRDEPARLPDDQGGTVAFTYADLVASTLGAMYNTRAWPAFAEFLQELDTQAGSHASAAALRRVHAGLGTHREADYDNSVEGYPGVTCSDSDNPDNVQAWTGAAAAADRRHPYFGRIWGWGSSACQSWPGRDDDRFTGPFTAHTANPVLVIGTRFDPATRYQDAESLAAMQPGSRLLTLEGWGHTSFGVASSCVDGYVSRYLLTSQVPPFGAACQPDVIPFAQPADAAQADDHPTIIPPVIRRAIAASGHE